MELENAKPYIYKCKCGTNEVEHLGCVLHRLLIQYVVRHTITLYNPIFEPPDMGIPTAACAMPYCYADPAIVIRLNTRGTAGSDNW